MILSRGLATRQIGVKDKGNVYPITWEGASWQSEKMRFILSFLCKLDKILTFLKYYQ
jgi:hypothetical protein